MTIVGRAISVYACAMRRGSPGGRAAAVGGAMVWLTCSFAACSSDTSVPLAGPRCPASSGGEGEGEGGGSDNQVIVEALEPGPCLQRTMSLDAEHRAPCTIVEAIRVDDASTGCNAAARAVLCDAHLIAAIERSPEFAAGQWNAFCEVEQLSGEPLRACQFDLADPPDAAGWCYVDGVAPLGNPDLVAECPATEKRRIRFVGIGEAPRSAGQLFLSCSSGP